MSPGEDGTLGRENEEGMPLVKFVWGGKRVNGRHKHVNQ